jgi:hypothetical protein
MVLDGPGFLSGAFLLSGIFLEGGSVICLGFFVKNVVQIMVFGVVKMDMSW